MLEISLSILTAERGMVPSCFALQLSSMPGVMYFISRVILPMIANPLMSVRRPGTALGDGRAKLNATISTRGTQS